MMVINKHQYAVRVQPLADNGEPCGNPITFVGREAWAVKELIKAGETGISSLYHVGIRLSHYVLKIRRAGLIVETVNAKHGGEHPGTHGVYILRSKARLIEEQIKAAA